MLQVPVNGAPRLYRSSVLRLLRQNTCSLYASLPIVPLYIAFYLFDQAFGIRSGHVIPGTTSSPERSSDVTTLVGFPGTSDSPKPGSPILLRESPDSTEGFLHPTPATWRWATLCYLVAHIRDVVAYRHLNEVSYQCIAICFGPVFFGDSTNLPRLNGVNIHNSTFQWIVNYSASIAKISLE